MMLNLLMRVPGILGTFNSDLLWLERTFIPGLDPLIQLTKGPRVLDVDDAIWIMNPLGVAAAKYAARSVDVILAGNSFLANWYSEYCDHVHVVPTSVDIARYMPRGEAAKDRPFVVGWTGTSSNFKYLIQIESALARFLSSHSEARLMIVADRRPEFRQIPAERLDFFPWSVATEASILRQMDVGIMPLDDTDWSRGKCSFKMLQYMATALPVVVSPVGMNAEILQRGFIGFGAATNDDWFDQLDLLYKDRDLGAKLGAAGAELVRSTYSTAVIANRVAAIFREIV